MTFAVQLHKCRKTKSWGWSIWFDGVRWGDSGFATRDMAMEACRSKLAPHAVVFTLVE